MPQGGGKPKGARTDAACGEIQRRTSQPAAGSNPWSEVAPGQGPIRALHHPYAHDPSRRAAAARSRKAREGEAKESKPASAGRQAKQGRQSHEGMPRRETRRPLSGQASKGEPRGRARMKHAGEVAGGARRRGTQEVRGRNMTGVRQAREWWLPVTG